MPRAKHQKPRLKKRWLEERTRPEQPDHDAPERDAYLWPRDYPENLLMTEDEASHLHPIQPAMPYVAKRMLKADYVDGYETHRNRNQELIEAELRGDIYAP